MLVCSVSLRPPRSAIAADIAEAAAALDDLGSGSGQVVFATLVDDPASVNEIVDAYLGEIMIEAANAVDAADAGYVYSIAIAEAASADSTQSGAISTVAPVSFNPADRVGMTLTLTNSNLTATGTSGTVGYVRTTGGQVGGKFYFETVVGAGTLDNSDGIGLITGSAALAATWDGFGLNGTKTWLSTGDMWINNGGPAATLGALSTGQTLCTAVDLVNKRFWQRINNGNWNNSGTADPATNVGGADISAVFTGTVPAFVALSLIFVGKTVTANFGATSFTYTVPSGFSGGPVA